MGEDSCVNPTMEKKPNITELSGLRNGDHSFPNSSTMSTCSEIDSETNSYVDDDVDQDFQYGPGIVSKLRTKFLTISLKQNRGATASMRRSCSLENILEQKTNLKSSNGFAASDRFGDKSNNASNHATTSWSNLKRAKSMDTLLMSLEKESSAVTNCSESEVDHQKPREPKVIRRRDGPLNRTTVTITDEEFPKPDTVKTYKRMFEPAESKKTNSNSNVRRRPPVLRATAKSGSNSNQKSTSQTNGKLNGVISTKPAPPLKKSNLSAKETPVKDIVLEVTSLENNPKIEPADKESNCKEVETLNKKNANNQGVKKNDLICNGTVRAEAIQLKVKDEIAKRNQRSPKCPDGKPKLPLRKPSPLKTIPPKLIIAQTVETKTCKTMKELKAVAPEKVAAKTALSKFPEKRHVKNEVKNKIERLEASDIVENGFSKSEDELPPEPAEKEHQLKPLMNGDSPAEVTEDSTQSIHHGSKDLTESNSSTTPHSLDVKGFKRVSTAPGGNNSMVFDFRGKDVVSHLSISPAPFGCKAAVRRRNVLIDGKESMPYLNGYANGGEADSDDEDYTDYSVPAPCGLVFEGENVKVGKGSILATRNKDLKIHFDEDLEKNTFVYPSESSLSTDDSSLTSTSSSDFSSLDSMTPAETTKLANGSNVSSPKLPSNTAINSSGAGGLMSYTPSVLRTVDNFQPGLFRAQDEKKKKSDEAEGEEENRERKDQDGHDSDNESSAMLKPADPEFISSWSLSASTSDLLF